MQGSFSGFLRKRVTVGKKKREGWKGEGEGRGGGARAEGECDGFERMIHNH